MRFCLSFADTSTYLDNVCIENSCAAQRCSVPLHAGPRFRHGVERCETRYFGVFVVGWFAAHVCHVCSSSSHAPREARPGRQCIGTELSGVPKQGRKHTLACTCCVLLLTCLFFESYASDRRSQIVSNAHLVASMGCCKQRRAAIVGSGPCVPGLDWCIWLQAGRNEVYAIPANLVCWRRSSSSCFRSA